MAVTYTDLIDGNSGRETIDGWELTRIAVVTGVTGGQGYDRVIDARAELPAIGAAHPRVTECLLREVIPESLDTETVKFRLVYSVPTPARFFPQLETIEVGGTLTQVQTNKDKDGNVIIVGYTYPATYKYNTDLQSQFVETSALVPKFEPEHSIVYSNLLYYNPQGLAAEYVGTVNLSAWVLAPDAALAQWLCTGIVGRSNDGGASYATTYTFQYRRDTWESTVVFIDPHTGVPPKDLAVGTGIRSIALYPVRNFNLIFS